MWPESTNPGSDASGHELAEVCLSLGAWGARWREVRPEDQDPYLALWMLSRMVTTDTGRAAPNRFWLVLSATGSEVCAENPGFAEDGHVTTDVASLIRWHAGEVTLGAAQRGGGLSVTAPTWLVRQLSQWGR